MLVGYARTSTMDQTAGLEGQLRDLAAAGCEKVFQEQVSSVDRGSRAELDAALEYVRQGDRLVVTKLDRLARSVSHLVEIKDRLQARDAHLMVLDMNLDTSTATGALLLNLVGSIAEFERQIMLERQREGIAKAKAAGKYKGRAPTARAKADDVLELRAQGVGPTEIAQRVGIGRASVYRILAEAQ
ncbi:recombinase family protein [Rhodobacterales bacterium HKCCE3408]|nr:recombinase family protein [Rhodobacterales bacterium HKCCE3408]